MKNYFINAEKRRQLLFKTMATVGIGLMVYGGLSITNNLGGLRTVARERK